MSRRAQELKERALQTFAPSRTHYLQSWPLKPDVCPCDVQFCDYLKEKNIRNKAIFHFGTGCHHLVGVRNREDALDNDVFAVTLSPAEHARYVKEVIRSAYFGAHYKVLFGDIYNFSAACLPSFDVITLFHLGEVTEPASPRRRLNDTGILELFLSKARPEARLVFYSGSWGYPQTKPLLEEAEAGGQVWFEERYRTLRVYRVTSPKS